MDSVTFQLKTRGDDPATLTGTLRLEAGQVVVQWTRITQFFPRSQKVEEVALPYPHVAEAEVVVPRFWGRPRLILVPRTLDPVARIPGVHSPGKLDFWVSKMDLPAARSIVSLINLKVSEAALDRATDSLGI